MPADSKRILSVQLTFQKVGRNRLICNSRWFVCLFFKTLPPRGFRVDSDLNLSPPSWLESWLNVLRRYFGTLQLQGTTPPMVRSQHMYGLPVIHNACVVQCIGSIPNDVIQHVKPTAAISIFPWRAGDITQGGHPSKY
jgi:hypothetical protein